VERALDRVAAEPPAGERRELVRAAILDRVNAAFDLEERDRDALDEDGARPPSGTSSRPAART
jgi:hypothetical protein